MESIRNYPKIEREFFEDKKGNIKYISYCLNCSNSCKQSYKVLKITCQKKDLVHSPKEYIDEISKQGKNIDTIGREVGVNSRTVKSMLNENQDMSFEVYDKLDKLLFPNSKRNSKK